MDKEDQLRQIQEELEQLHQQVKKQQQQIVALYQKAAALSDTPLHLRKPGTKSAFSMENFIGLRLIHLIGIIVLVIGLSIGVKYAIDKELISAFMRIALAYLAGFLLFGLSYRLRKNYTVFSAILFSGAMASLYFTTYAAFVYYNMVPFFLAFLIMVALTVYSAYQAIGYDRKEIALLGLIGAYGIPFLISRNQERADLFFCYIMLINIGVVYLSIKKQWKIVGRVALLITWILFIGWAGTRLQSGMRWVGALFMTLFFILFHLNILSPKIFREKTLSQRDTYQLVMNNLAVYILSLLLFGYKSVTSDVAITTFFMSLFLFVQAGLLLYRWPEETYAERLLASFGFILLALFIALEWTGVVVTFLWLLTAVVTFLLGVWRKSVTTRMAAIILMGVTLLKLVLWDSLTFTSVQKIISYISLGILLLVVSFFYQKFKENLFNDQ